MLKENQFQFVVASACPAGRTKRRKAKENIFHFTQIKTDVMHDLSGENEEKRLVKIMKLSHVTCYDGSRTKAE